MKTLKLVDGLHVTITELQSIKHMLEKGWTYCTNKPKTKSYVINKGTPIEGGFQYEILIGSYYTATLGANPQWNYNKVTLEYSERKKLKHTAQSSISFN